MAGLDTGHEAFVLDAQYDYYGRRFATCSSDHSVRVWDQAPETSTGWRNTACIRGVRDRARVMIPPFPPGCLVIQQPHRIPQASKSAISKITWAFPEFGQLIAVCSEDGSVTIWEEQSECPVCHSTWVSASCVAYLSDLSQMNREQKSHPMVGEGGCVELRSRRVCAQSRTSSSLRGTWG